MLMLLVGDENDEEIMTSRLIQVGRLKRLQSNYHDYFCFQTRPLPNVLSTNTLSFMDEKNVQVYMGVNPAAVSAVLRVACCAWWF